MTKRLTLALCIAMMLPTAGLAQLMGEVQTPPQKPKPAAKPKPVMKPPVKKPVSKPVVKKPVFTVPVIAKPYVAPATSGLKSYTVLDQTGAGDAVTLADAIAKTATGGTIQMRAGSYRYSGSLPRSISLIGIVKNEPKSGGGTTATVPDIYNDTPDSTTLWIDEGTHRIESVFIQASGSNATAFAVYGGNTTLVRGGMRWNGTRANPPATNGRALFVDGASATLSMDGSSIGPGEKNAMQVRAGNVTVNNGYFYNDNGSWAAIWGYSNSRTTVKNSRFYDSYPLMLTENAVIDFTNNTVQRPSGNLVLFAYRSKAASANRSNIVCLNPNEANSVFQVDAGATAPSRSGNVYADGTPMESNSFTFTAQQVIDMKKQCGR